MSRRRSEASMLERILEWAARREQNDDHLTTVERQDVIRRYVAVHPEHRLSGNVDNDFVDIVLG